MDKNKVVIIGAAESGVGAALLAKKDNKDITISLLKKRDILLKD